MITCTTHRALTATNFGHKQIHKNTDEQTLERWDSFKVENDRCLYENEDILVTHSIVHFPNGTADAVMMVHMKKDGLLWRTETGSTPMPKE